MVHDGGVKDQGGGEEEATGIDQANSSSSSSSRSDLISKKLGVRHPLKHKRFRAGGKTMADPDGEEQGSTSAPPDTDVTAASVEASPDRATSGEVNTSPDDATPADVNTSPDRATCAVVDTSSDAAMSAEVEKGETEEEDIGYMSGGWKSEDGRLSCGYASFRGKRATMEDFYDAKSSQIEGKIVNLFGIFDGHGGSRAAEYLKEHLFNNLMKHPQFMNDTKLAIST